MGMMGSSPPHGRPCGSKWTRTRRSEQLMVKTVQGIVHGKTIQLQEDLGVAEGQQVEIQVRVVPAAKPSVEGLRRCAGALSDEWTEEDDRILEEIYQDRKRDTRREI